MELMLLKEKLLPQSHICAEQKCSRGLHNEIGNMCDVNSPGFKVEVIEGRKLLVGAFVF